MLAIRIYGDPVLRKTAKPVTSFDAGLRRLIGEMLPIMRDFDGVGLAATQVGKSVQVAVIDTTAGEKEPFVLVNPEVTWSSDELADEEEGCLSVPTIRLKVKRPARVSVRALDINGKPYAIDKAEGVLARALQHEIDHLNGILFIDRISSLQRQLIKSKLKKLAKSGDEEK